MLRNSDQSKTILTYSLKLLIFHQIKYFPHILSSLITINALKSGFFGSEVALNFEAQDVEQWSHQVDNSTFLCPTAIHHQQLDLSNFHSFQRKIELLVPGNATNMLSLLWISKAKEESS